MEWTRYPRFEIERGDSVQFGVPATTGTAWRVALLVRNESRGAVRWFREDVMEEIFGRSAQGVAGAQFVYWTNTTDEGAARASIEE